MRRDRRLLALANKAIQNAHYQYEFMGKSYFNDHILEAMEYQQEVLENLVNSKVRRNKYEAEKK